MALIPLKPQRMTYSTARNWSNLLGGAALIMLGLRQRQPGGLVLSLLGSGLLLKSAAAGRGSDDNGQTHPSSVQHIARHGLTIEQTLVVQRPPEVLYRFWRDFANLPRFMRHLRSVTVLDDKRTHWVVNAPAGLAVEWDAMILREIENELIAWCSLENADVSNTGLVHFESLPEERGTRVKVILRYEPPAGKLGAAFAKLFGQDPDQQVQEDLNRFKQIMESGEIPSAREQPNGRHRPLPLKGETMPLIKLPPASHPMQTARLATDLLEEDYENPPSLWPSRRLQHTPWEDHPQSPQLAQEIVAGSAPQHAIADEGDTDEEPLGFDRELLERDWHHWELNLASQPQSSDPGDDEDDDWDDEEEDDDFLGQDDED